MRSLITTTAIALLLGGPVLAQQQVDTQIETTEGQAAAQAGFYQPRQGDVMVTDLVGTDVFLPRSGTGAGMDQMDQSATDPLAGEQGTAQVQTDPDLTEQAGTDQPATDPLAAEQGTTQVQTGAQTGQVEVDMGDRSVTAEVLAELDNIGSVQDMVLDAEGNLQAVLVDAGGFLDTGARWIALDADAVRFAVDAEDPEQRYIIGEVSSEALQSAPEFDPAALQGQRTAQTGTQPGVQPGDPVMPDGEVGTVGGATTAWRDRTLMTPPVIEREGFAMAEADQFTADGLLGANVFDANDQSIGDIDDVVLSQDGQIEYVVLDVGGFLGIGGRTVALSIDELTILQAQDTDQLRAYVNVTREQLETMPEYQDG